jgi:hypothetical protein
MSKDASRNDEYWDLYDFYEDYWKPYISSNIHNNKINKSGQNGHYNKIANRDGAYGGGHGYSQPQRPSSNYYSSEGE